MWELAKKTGTALIVGASIGLAVWAGMSVLAAALPEVALGGAGFEGAIANPAYIASFFALIQAGVEVVAPIVHNILGTEKNREVSPTQEPELERQQEQSHEYLVGNSADIQHGVVAPDPSIDASSVFTTAMNNMPIILSDKTPHNHTIQKSSSHQQALQDKQHLEAEHTSLRQ